MATIAKSIHTQRQDKVGQLLVKTCDNFSEGTRKIPITGEKTALKAVFKTSSTQVQIGENWLRVQSPINELFKLELGAQKGSRKLPGAGRNPWLRKTPGTGTYIVAGQTT